jgi:hypothetical protein
MTIDEVCEDVSKLRLENSDLMDRPHFKFLSEFDSVVATAKFINGDHPGARSTGSLKAVLRNLESTISLCRKQDEHKSN